MTNTWDTVMLNWLNRFSYRDISPSWPAAAHALLYATKPKDDDNEVSNDDDDKMLGWDQNEKQIRWWWWWWWYDDNSNEGDSYNE